MIINQQETIPRGRIICIHQGLISVQFREHYREWEKIEVRLRVQIFDQARSDEGVLRATLTPPQISTPWISGQQEISLAVAIELDHIAPKTELVISEIQKEVNQLADVYAQLKPCVQRWHDQTFHLRNLLTMKARSFDP
jgi:hypothetical protein